LRSDIEILCGVSFEPPSTTLPQPHHQHDDARHNSSLVQIYAASKASSCEQDDEVMKLRQSQCLMVRVSGIQFSQASTRAASTPLHTDHHKGSGRIPIDLMISGRASSAARSLPWSRSTVALLTARSGLPTQALSLLTTHNHNKGNEKSSRKLSSFLSKSRASFRWYRGSCD
jgi:hypothetical protein